MDDPVFTNNSNYPQIAIETQLAIALYQFGHDGNSASLQSFANWAGVSKRMVHLVTRWVMTAVLCPEFRKLAVHFPTPSENDEDDAVMLDLFIVEGLSSASDSDHDIPLPSQSSRTRLQAGKYHRQKLKERLLQAKARYQDRHG